MIVPCIKCIQLEFRGAINIDGTTDNHISLSEARNIFVTSKGKICEEYIFCVNF